MSHFDDDDFYDDDDDSLISESDFLAYQSDIEEYDELGDESWSDFSDSSNNDDITTLDIKKLFNVEFQHIPHQHQDHLINYGRH